MSIASDWHPPENTYVEVEGDDCPVPEIDQPLLDQILKCSMHVENNERLSDMADVLAWLKALSDAEVEGGVVYFNERWTWDNGHPLDLFFLRILEKERARRRALTDHIGVARMMEILDLIAEKERNGDS